jgi:hypothetical protein
MADDDGLHAIDSVRADDFGVHHHRHLQFESQASPDNERWPRLPMTQLRLTVQEIAVHAVVGLTEPARAPAIESLRALSPTS